MTNIPHVAITILGLGPGNIHDLTLQARTILEQAAQAQHSVYFRTLIHPTVDALRHDLPHLQMVSFDTLYDESDDWSTLYQQIAERVCTMAAQQPVIYAVPGHPLIGEASVQLVLQQARLHSLTTHIVAGLSFIEPVCTILGLDPFDAGTQLVDATNLAALNQDEIAGKIIPTVPLLVTQVYNRRLASEVKLALSECYPDEWPVKLVRAAGVQMDGSNNGETVLELPLYELDRNTFANHLSTLYVPPIDPLTALRLPETQRYIIMRLRRDPDGCPWDRQQTHQSLSRYVLEEAYEVVEAIEEHDTEHLAEELGDLLLQVYLHAEVARQANEFSIGDVYEQINAKLIRRHPHVFGTVEVNSAGQVIQNWEAIKRQEKQQAGVEKQESVLDGVPLASPALTIAQEYQKKAVKVGFDYNTIEWVYRKMSEEISELQEATNSEHQFEEVGDVLFMAAMIAQAHKVNAEEALRAANRKFRQRFLAMEEIIREQGRELSSYSTKEWGELWRGVKQGE